MFDVGHVNRCIPMAHRMHVINPYKPVSLLDVHMWISNGHNSSLELLTDTSTLFCLKYK